MSFSRALSGVPGASGLRPVHWMAAIALVLLAGGCASEEAPPSRVAGPQRPAEAQSIKIEIEDDGLPSQLAPRGPSRIPDEPTEPWSRNYGAVRSASVDTDRVTAKPGSPAEPIPTPTPAHPPHARPLDAEDIIRHAIADHEMRQR